MLFRSIREWVWRTCPPTWAQGMRKPLQEEEHSIGPASEDVGEVGKRPAQDGLLEAVAQWRRVSR